MTTALKLSAIALTAALGTSTVSATQPNGEANRFSAPPTPTTNTNYDAYGNVNVSSGNNSVTAGGNNSTTVLNIHYKEPKIINERYNMGPCSGPAYQALWQTVKLASIFGKRPVDGLVAVTDNSFTIRQYWTDSREERKSTANLLEQKLHPKIEPAQSEKINDVNSTSTGATGGNNNVSVSSSSASVSLTIPQSYKHITYHCTLDK